MDFKSKTQSNGTDSLRDNIESLDKYLKETEHKLADIRKRIEYLGNKVGWKD